MNKVILSGNLTRNLELKTTNSGKTYVRGSITVNHARSKNAPTDFYNFVEWENTAEFLEQVFIKGKK